MGSTTSAIFALSIVSLVLTWLMVTLRLFVRIKIRPSFGVDDSLLIVGWLLATAQFIIPLYEPRCKLRKDPGLLSLDDIESNYICRFSGELLWVAATGLVKISFCFTLLRFLQVHWQRWCIWSTIAVIFTISVFYFFWLVFDCKPIRYFWQQVKAPTSGSCKPAAALADATYAHASVLLAADAVLAFVPLLVVHYLHADWRVKISVAAILTIGSISCVATIVRLTLVHQVLAAGSFLRATYKLALWAIVEVSTSIVAVSATALRPLWEILRVIPRYSFGRSYESEGGTPLHNIEPPRTTSTDHLLESYHMSQDSEGIRLKAPERTGFGGYT
ncbi:hypothetical protein BJX65DRAFT_291002 [Aspergillus insuetus]